MTRKELYEVIKKSNLESAIKSHYGKNYTLISNRDLEKFYLLHSGNSTEVVLKSHSKIITNLVEVLKKKRILLDSEVKSILNA